MALEAEKWLLSDVAVDKLSAVLLDKLLLAPEVDKRSVDIVDKRLAVLLVHLHLFRAPIVVDKQLAVLLVHLRLFRAPIVVDKTSRLNREQSREINR